jgi:uncharacterized SAM-binding protein YcdF (DUF218 family)
VLGLGPRWFRIAWKVGLAVFVVLALYVGGTFFQVWQASRHDQAQDAGAIVVMGAAQYNGDPSPVFEARLQHGLELYQQGLSDLIFVTGGNQEGDEFTEARAGALWLEDQGVPESALRLEVQGRNSWESLAASARILREEGIEDVIVVSDPFHAKRLEEIADEVGLEAYVSPTGSSPVSGTAEFRAMIRETVAVSVGRFLGYRRLMNLDDTVNNTGG